MPGIGRLHVQFRARRAGAHGAVHGEDEFHHRHAERAGAAGRDRRGSSAANPAGACDDGDGRSASGRGTLGPAPSRAPIDEAIPEPAPKPIALVAPPKPLRASPFVARAGLWPPLPRRQADQFRQGLAETAGRAWRRRLALAGRDRLAEAAHAGRQLRLHQGHRRRRPSRPDVQEELARRRRQPA